MEYARLVNRNQTKDQQQKENEATAKKRTTKISLTKEKKTQRDFEWQTTVWELLDGFIWPRNNRRWRAASVSREKKNVFTGITSPLPLVHLVKTRKIHIFLAQTLTTTAEFTKILSSKWKLSEKEKRQKEKRKMKSKPNGDESTSPSAATTYTIEWKWMVNVAGVQRRRWTENIIEMFVAFDIFLCFRSSAGGPTVPSVVRWCCWY